MNCTPAPAGGTDAPIAKCPKRKRACAEAQPARLQHPEPTKEPDEATCSICLMALCDGKSGLTHCGHSFHSACLATWMLTCRAHTCPECRAYVGASASMSRMFVTVSDKEQEKDEWPPRKNLRADKAGKRMPRFHGG